MTQDKTLRLIYPQWQGADITRWVPEIEDPAEAARGYYLGAALLDFLAPDNGQRTLTVPVSTERKERRVTQGVLDRDDLLRQSRAALGILEVEQPDRIVTLGGECSVSVVPFTWLARKYAGDVALVWVDAHPDITLPGDAYAGYHAMAAAACMGLGDPALVGLLPARIPASRILYVGLRDWEREEIRRRQQEYGLPYLSPAHLRTDPDALGRWLRACDAKHVLVHFDMDVLDPAEIIPAVGVSPDGMKLAEVVRAIRMIAQEKDLVGLTVAEPMPRIAIRLKRMLEQLPLLGTPSC